MVGVLVEQGIRNEEIDKILQRLPEHAGDTRIVTDFDVNKLLVTCAPAAVVPG